MSSVPQSDDFEYVARGDREDDLREHFDQVRQDDERDARWTAFEVIVRDAYRNELDCRRRLGMNIDPIVAIGVVAQRIASVIRYHQGDNDIRFASFDGFGNALREFAESDGWPDVWACFARTVKILTVEHESAARLLREGRY